MIKMYCNVCNKYRKLKNSKYIIYFQKKLDLSIFYTDCSHEYKEIFKEEEPIEILKILGLITNIKSIRSNINMSEESTIQEFRLKNIDETTNYFIKEIN